MESFENSSLWEQAGVNTGPYKTVYTLVITELVKEAFLMNQEMFLLL